jgi:hypothetical protein
MWHPIIIRLTSIMAGYCAERPWVDAGILLTRRRRLFLVRFRSMMCLCADSF